MTKNRIATIESKADTNARQEAYSKLLYSILTKTAATPNPLESNTLARALRSEKDPLTQSFLWRLLTTAPADPPARDLALAALKDSNYPNRGDAMAYLQLRYPNLMPSLMSAYQDDPDPEVIYHLSEYMRVLDPQKSIDMKINLLPLIRSHELHDALLIDISEMGMHRHLEELQRRDREKEGGTVFGTAADMLRAKLERLH